MSRPYTNRLIDLCNDGSLSKEQIFNELMSYLSEQDIKEFCLEGFASEIADLFNDLEGD